MSDLSLLRGVYADVEAYGTLIDRVIERLGRGGPICPIQIRRSSGGFSLMPVIRASNHSPLRR